MFVPSGCFLRRGTSQPFWYFSVSEAFFSVGLVQALAVFFPRHPDFSSGIFCVLRMPLAVFFPAIPVFGVSGAFFLFVLCRRLPCFSPVIPIFHPESFAFCGCHLPCFFQPYRYLGFLELFFCLFCAGACRVFPPSSRFFIRNLLRFADATCRFLSAIPAF